MPSWVVASGESLGASKIGGTTAYACLVGAYLASGVEADLRYKMRDSYTLSKLFARVVTNTLSGATTVRSRKNSANGNQSVSIGGGVTGAFEDNVNSDSFVSGDYVGSQSVAGADGVNTMAISVIAYKLEASTGVPPLGSAVGGGESVNTGLTRYTRITGRGMVDANEAFAQYIFRVAATLSYLRIYVNSNTLDGASTFRTRKNGANGNQSVSIGAGLTGEFEDAVNTDSVAVGNTVNFQIVAGGAVGKIKFSVSQLKSSSTGRQAGMGVLTCNFATTVYTLFEGYEKHATESYTQVLARTPFGARNFIALVANNTLDGATTIRTRKNGGNGNLNVSVGAGVSGTFEDTTHLDTFGTADYVDYQVVAAGTAGMIWVYMIAFEQQAPQPPPAGGSMAAKMIAGKLI